MKLYLFITVCIICIIILLVNGSILSTEHESLTTIDESAAMATSYDTIFHDSIEDIKEQSNAYIPMMKTVTVIGDDGNKVDINIPKTLAGATYYDPGTYKYSGESYVPSYEDSVYLSDSIGVVPRYAPHNFKPIPSEKDEANRKSYKKDQLKSLGTRYYSNDDLIIPVDDEQNVTFAPKNAKVTTTPNRASQLQVTYSVSKTQEEIDYENKVSALLDDQKEILNYATAAPLNVQQKIRTPAPITTIENKLPIDFKDKNVLYDSGQRVLQKNKFAAFKIPAGDIMSRKSLLASSYQ
jgi:hypothetical protein